ncbi:hypothetical protein D9615_004724 [Tricholomella constricta]|uniref:pH-response regulator protein palC n=1 Tax=Tricholomella constricta TaxID=117010 RepID=A0A8H5HCJ9_9AGAR|nr:hypothetical protein D9615_004724 [Tricholomella constricta]
MASSIFSEKRTRSQLTLPDRLLFQLSQGSPMKDARTALKINLNLEPSVDTRVESAEETDDELLLSPTKVVPTTRTTKRSVSPPPKDEYATRPDSPSDKRELKRQKRDGDGDPAPNGEGSSNNPVARSSHTRSLSQPEPTRKSTRIRSATNSRAGTPAPSNLYSDKNTMPGKGRAQSVPLFPSSSSSNVLHIDLRNPPPSPRRPRSRSPSKEREFRIVAGTPAVTKLATIPDERSLSLERERPGTAPPTEEPSIHETPPMPVMPPLSPLTPLPETPHPSSTEHNYTGIEWCNHIEEGDEDQVSTSAQEALKPLPGLGATTKSRLPRPSSSINLAASATGPSPTTMRQTMLMGPPSTVAAAQIAVASGSSEKPTPISAQPTDAFALMMAKARESKEKGKGKEKASGTATKASGSSKLTQKSKADKGKERETQPPKISIKMKMKAKGKSRPKPVPVPVPAPSLSSEFEDRPLRSPSPQAPSPFNILHSSHPSTLPIMDVSMESIDPAVMVEDELFAIVANSTTTAEPVATASAITAAPNTTLPTPTIKSTTTKLHISKRVPVAVASVGRVTRSTSLRRNLKTPEVPKPVLKKPSGKQAAVRKKSIPCFEPTVAGPSNQSTDDVPHDPAASTSSLSDLPTDPVVPTLSLGSPMKLSSPKKNFTQAAETSFSRPTQSTVAKQALSKSPGKSRPDRPAASSPSKLTRSASMFSSRPAGSLSRTFTGYGGIAGSSLSTLSSALEKLHQPPPGRPNTSMGFNRDGLDSSFELKGTSKDDTSVGPSASKSSSGGASSPAKAAGGSRLMQRTLITGPRSSVTGKSIFGAGTVLRGPGGFKVPGNALKTGSRIFGVGGGAFTGTTRVRTLQKASRKTSLPSVMASPVKGGDGGDATDVAHNDEQEPEVGSSTTVFADQGLPLNDKGKGKERSADSWRSNASRRVSLASQALSQSLNELPSKASPGLMGPPMTPTRKGTRSASSTYPSSEAFMPSGGDGERLSPSTRSVTMGLRNAALSVSKSGAGTSKISAASAASRATEALKVLKDCVIFVDVRTDDGDEAGSLFVEMLEGVGARILTRVGQTCTHIVFKNGLMSTLTRYRLLRDPKPLVVGIAWVVECVEQRKQVDETKFLIDLEVNIAVVTQARANVRAVLKDSKRTDHSQKDFLQLVKLLEDYIPQLRGIMECLAHDEISLKSELSFSWRTTLSANIFNTSPRLSLPGLQADLAFSLLTYAFALSNLARSTANSLGRYERDRAISDSERKAKDEQLNVAVDFLCRVSGIYTYVGDTVLPEWETHIRGRPTGFEKPPDLSREVNSALAKMALADAQSLAIRKLLSKAAFESNIAPGPPLPRSHPSPALIAKLHLECASLYSSARSLVKTTDARKRPSPAPESGSEVSAELRRYLTDQTALHAALARKWLGVDAGEKGGSERGGEAVGYLAWAKKELEELEDDKKGLGIVRGRDKDVRERLKEKISDELESVNLFYRYYKKSNDSLHFKSVPMQADLQARIPAGIMAIRAKPYVPPTPTFGPGSVTHLQAQTTELVLDDSSYKSTDTLSPLPAGTYAGAGSYF